MPTMDDLIEMDKQWNAQCMKNNPAYIIQRAKAKDGYTKMLITASAYYGGIEKIPPAQMKIYEMLEKNINRRQDMHLNER